MNRTAAIISLLAMPLVVPHAAAQTAPPAKSSPAPGLDGKGQPLAGDNGRFTMTPSGDGFLRLDTRTGSVSFCAVKDGAAQCRSSADERGALESEIGRLSSENAKLRSGSAASGVPAAGASQSLSASLPSDAEVDHAIGLMDKIVRGTIRIMKEVDSATQD